MFMFLLLNFNEYSFAQEGIIKCNPEVVVGARYLPESQSWDPSKFGSIASFYFHSPSEANKQYDRASDEWLVSREGLSPKLYGKCDAHNNGSKLIVECRAVTGEFIWLDVKNMMYQHFDRGGVFVSNPSLKGDTILSFGSCEEDNGT